MTPYLVPNLLYKRFPSFCLSTNKRNWCSAVHDGLNKLSHIAKLTILTIAKLTILTIQYLQYLQLTILTTYNTYNLQYLQYLQLQNLQYLQFKPLETHPQRSKEEDKSIRTTVFRLADYNVSYQMTKSFIPDKFTVCKPRSSYRTGSFCFTTCAMRAWCVVMEKQCSKPIYHIFLAQCSACQIYG